MTKEIQAMVQAIVRARYAAAAGDAEAECASQFGFGGLSSSSSSQWGVEGSSSSMGGGPASSSGVGSCSGAGSRGGLGGGSSSTGSAPSGAPPGPVPNHQALAQELGKLGFTQSQVRRRHQASLFDGPNVEP